MPWRSPPRPRRAQPARAVLAAAAGTLLLAVVLGACGSPSPPATQERVAGGATGHYDVEAGIHKIKHVIVIEQENRSFDSYFGTYPGGRRHSDEERRADRVRARTRRADARAPYHDTADVNGGGPHGVRNARLDVNGGKMDGFIASATSGKKGCGANVNTVDNPACSNSATPDVMGYHTAAEIPNYWTYAKDFALDDHMFEPVDVVVPPRSPLPGLGLVGQVLEPSPSSCVNEIRGPYTPAQMQRYVDQAINTGTADITNAWTDITWLLYNKHVSWAYYVQTGDQPDCDNDSAVACPPVAQSYLTPGNLEPAPRLRGRAEGSPASQHPAAEQVLRGSQEGNTARGHVGHALAGRQRAPTGQRPPGPGLCHRGDQRGDEEPRLGLDGHLLAVGRLGRLLRQRRPAAGGPERLRAPGAGDGDLALRQDGLHRPPDPLERRLPQVHRGRLPGRLPPQPQDGRTTRSTARRP